MADAPAVATFLARVEATVTARDMLKGGERVVAAVSGGPDSLAMLHALARLAPRLDLSLHVAHLDHRLRPGSAADAAAVARAARRLGLPATVRAADGAGRPPGRSPEEAARERRYAFLEEVADRVGADRIATGHTMDDQAETVLMRVLAGTGTRGLGGIPPVRGRVIRPLIDVRREEVEAFLRALRVRPRRDPTNADPAFLRNAIRLELLPLLRERFNRRVVEALARLADVARDEDALLEELVADAVQLEPVGEELRLRVEDLLALPPALARRALRRLAPLDAAHTERVLALARAGATGQEASLPGGLNARLEYGWLVVGRASPRPAPAAPVALLLPGVTDLPLWSMRIGAWVTETAPSAWPDGRRACVLDGDRARPPLAVRPPRPGDRFRPLGMAGAKKLGDFFTDAKVPRDARARTPLVTSRGAIAWVIGHRPDDRFKVTRRTRRFLWMRVLEEGEPWPS
jgi:tRNA(Ile)-lysidine synthase